MALSGHDTCTCWQFHHSVLAYIRSLHTCSLLMLLFAQNKWHIIYNQKNHQKFEIVNIRISALWSGNHTAKQKYVACSYTSTNTGHVSIGGSHLHLPNVQKIIYLNWHSNNSWLTHNYIACQTLGWNMKVTLCKYSVSD